MSLPYEPHKIPMHDLLASLATSKEQGLATQEVLLRQERDGYNRIQTQQATPWYRIVLKQFASPLILILIAAVGIAAGIGEYIDAAIIAFVIFFNAILGAYQEIKAQRTFLALSNLDASSVVVRRNGVEGIVDSAELVVGDIVILNEGERIPADMRLIETSGIEVNESILTGESLAISKEVVDTCSDNRYECSALLWGGTYITKGKAVAVVTSIAGNTRMGTLAQEVSSADREVPLQKRVRKLARSLIYISLGSIVVLFVLGIVFGRETHELIRIAISLLVSVVPEGLPVVMTLILSVGVFRMSKENVLVKRLHAIETLGHADVIAVDKTGTITRNEMMVSDIYVVGHTYTVSGVGYDPEGDIIGNGLDTSGPALRRIVTLAERSANASLIYDQQRTKVIGDPTEAAMRVLGMKMGFQQEVLRKETPLAGEIPFDFKKKYYVSNFALADDSYEMVITGAGEVLLDHANYILDEFGEKQKLDDMRRTGVTDMIHQYSDQGLRVIGVAYRRISRPDINHDDVTDLVFVGLLGMKDAVRTSVPQALAAAREAGMQVVMITGDHVTTATALAREAGIFNDGDRVVSGPEIDTYNVQELSEHIKGATVFARVTPRHKMKIIQAFQHLGITIAMTGDGVNDVPPLSAADLGVAMGITGTEAAKESADIILLEDDFGDIPKAVEEGRNIAWSMKQVVVFLIATNIAELLIIMIAVIAGFPIPLTPAQIIWMNVVSDTFIVIALGLQRAAPQVLKIFDFDTITKKFITRADMARIVVRIIIMTAGPLAMFFLTYATMGNYMAATTSTLLTLVLVQVFNAWHMTKKTKGVMKDNRLFATSILALGLFGILFAIPQLGAIFGVVLPDGWILLVIFVVSLLVLVDFREVGVSK